MNFKFTLPQIDLSPTIKDITTSINDAKENFGIEIKKLESEISKKNKELEDNIKRKTEIIKQSIQELNDYKSEINKKDIKYIKMHFTAIQRKIKIAETEILGMQNELTRYTESYMQSITKYGTDRMNEINKIFEIILKSFDDILKEITDSTKKNLEDLIKSIALDIIKLKIPI